MSKEVAALHTKGVELYLDDPSIRKLMRIAESWGGGFTFMDVDIVLKCVDRDERRAVKRPNQERYYSHPDGGTASCALETHWRRRTIYLSPACCSPKAVLGYLIHEMGHVFADPKPPDDADELEWLGWEIALARWAGCYSAWDKWKDGFSLGGKKDLPRDIAALWQKYEDLCGYEKRIPSPHDTYASWGDLNAKGKLLLTRDRVQHGVAIGIIDPRTRRPLPVRRQPRGRVHLAEVEAS